LNGDAGGAEKAPDLVCLTAALPATPAQLADHHHHHVTQSSHSINAQLADVTTTRFSLTTQPFLCPCRVRVLCPDCQDHLGSIHSEAQALALIQQHGSSELGFLQFFNLHRTQPLIAGEADGSATD
jgi:hypothetical protein